MQATGVSKSVVHGGIGPLAVAQTIQPIGHMRRFLIPHARRGLQAAFFLGVEAPRDRQLFHISTIDLSQAGIMSVFRCAAVCGPVVPLETESKR
jgi:hypothetical protein